MVDKDPHEFKLNFGTQSLISDKAPGSATISLTSRSSQAKPCIQRWRAQSVQASAHLVLCIWNPVHPPSTPGESLSPCRPQLRHTASGKDFPGLPAGWVVLLTAHSYRMRLNYVR